MHYHDLIAVSYFLGLDHYSKTFRINERPVNLLLFDTGGAGLVYCAIAFIINYFL